MTFGFFKMEWRRLRKKNRKSWILEKALEEKTTTY